MADMSAWEVLGVPKEVQRGLSEQSFTTPTPIQTLSLPPAIFHHRDIIGAAETVSWIRAVRLVEVSFFMCIVCLLFFLLFRIIFFFVFFLKGVREREWKKNPFSTCTCIYYDVHLAHLRVRRLSHTLQQTVSVTLGLVCDLN